MSKELILKIKQELQAIDSLKSCQLVIKKDDCLTAKVIQIQKINESKEQLGAIEGNQYYAEYNKIIQKRLNENDHSAQIFLIETNLKIKDLSDIDRAFNIIKRLKLVNLEFSYIRGQE